MLPLGLGQDRMASITACSLVMSPLRSNHSPDISVTLPRPAGTRKFSTPNISRQIEFGLGCCASGWICRATPFSPGTLGAIWSNDAGSG
jgi:hypothetical protein